MRGVLSRRRSFVADIAPPDDKAEIPEETVSLASPRLRDSDLFLTLLAAGAGLLAGLGVIVLDEAVGWVRLLAFGLPFGGHLSDDASLPWQRILIVPIFGGIL